RSQSRSRSGFDPIYRPEGREPQIQCITLMPSIENNFWVARDPEAADSPQSLLTDNWDEHVLRIGETMPMKKPTLPLVHQSGRLLRQ
ncbi:MAG TPA: hypothetical protein VK729_15615, partial [Silvibacterium sp.]|nr:hypothetical protein [Silvibacterium sp.]